MKKLHNYGTFNNDLYKVDIRNENNLNKNLRTRCNRCFKRLNINAVNGGREKHVACRN